MKKLQRYVVICTLFFGLSVNGFAPDKGQMGNDTFLKPRLPRSSARKTTDLPRFDASQFNSVPSYEFESHALGSFSSYGSEQEEVGDNLVLAMSSLGIASQKAIVLPKSQAQKRIKRNDLSINYDSDEAEEDVKEQGCASGTQAPSNTPPPLPVARQSDGISSAVPGGSKFLDRGQVSFFFNKAKNDLDQRPIAIPRMRNPLSKNSK